jgi:hypothetical protein
LHLSAIEERLVSAIANLDKGKAKIPVEIVAAKKAADEATKIKPKDYSSKAPCGHMISPKSFKRGVCPICKIYFCPNSHVVSKDVYDAGNCTKCLSPPSRPVESKPVASSSSVSGRILPPTVTWADQVENDADETIDVSGVVELQSAVPSNPFVEIPQTLIPSLVVVKSAEDTAYGQYTDRGVITLRHIIHHGTFSIAGIFSPADQLTCTQDKVVPFPDHPELVLVKVRINNATPFDIKYIRPLSAAGPGALVTTTGTVTGHIMSDPHQPDLLLIKGGTKKGLCALPYVASNSVVGYHGYGNNNQIHNSGHAISAAHKAWLATQPKNF